MWVGNSYCNDCRDLDLCRDAALLEHDWRCVVPSCGQPYDRAWIENALLQIVRQRERLYHLQDLVCVKCRQVMPIHETVISFSNAHNCAMTQVFCAFKMEQIAWSYFKSLGQVSRNLT